MNDYNVPIIEPTIDYTKVPSINQKRTISFINQFLIHSATYLNKFALSCEERLYNFEFKLQRVEAALAILESRLSSIPGIEEISDSQVVEEKSEENIQNIEENNAIEKEIEIKEDTVPEESTSKEQSAQKDPRYEKYFKMMHFGVPKEAVKLKMRQEGLDPSILDDSQQSNST